jgi:steryl-sulfatase
MRPTIYACASVFVYLTGCPCLDVCVRVRVRVRVCVCVIRCSLPLLMQDVHAVVPQCTPITASSMHGQCQVVQQPTHMQNLTLELTDHAIRFINNSVAAEQPFFLLFAYVHVHTALFSSPMFTNVSRGGRFGDNLEELDWSVGQVLSTLTAHGIADNTLVLFTSGRSLCCTYLPPITHVHTHTASSIQTPYNPLAQRTFAQANLTRPPSLRPTHSLVDNGPYAEEGWDECGRTGGLAGSKGQTFEGGIRMPGIAMWPGVVPPGVVTDTLVSTLDIFPTALAIAGVPLPAGVIIDGRNMLPILRVPATTPTAHDWLWHYCGNNVTAGRHAGLKFHFATQRWTSAARPSPKCKQCCPYGPTSFNGTGGSMCDCASGDVDFHDPPLIFNMTADREERHPLTVSTFPGFAAAVAAAQDALAAHYVTVVGAKDQMHTLPDPLLQPCCNTPTILGVTERTCECDTFAEGKVYP